MTILATIAFGAFAAILLIWIGYPIAVWAVALVVRRPIRPDYERSRSRRVSVILATRDRPELIEARVKNLLDTDHAAGLIEVIVSLDADGAQATPNDLIGIDPRLRIVVGDVPGGKAAALNAGVRAATGEILVMADAAQRFDRRTIPELVASLEDARFSAVSGALSLGRDGKTMSPVHVYWEMEKWLRMNESVVHSSIGVTGAVYATRHSTWPGVPAGTLLDDVYVPMTLVLAGQRIGFNRLASAQDVRTFTAGAEGTRKERTLTGVLQLVRLVPGILSTRNPVVVQFVMHKLARLATPLLLLVAAAVTFAITCVMAWRYPREVMLPLAASFVLLFAIPPLRRKLFGAIGWGLSLQLATLIALSNGMRGRWSVWQNQR